MIGQDGDGSHGLKVNNVDLLTTLVVIKLAQYLSSSFFNYSALTNDILSAHNI